MSREVSDKISKLKQILKPSAPLSTLENYLKQQLNYIYPTELPIKKEVS